MAGSRDLLRVEATERLDKPDLDALQRNSRSDTRTSVTTLLFAAATVDKVMSGWQITANGPADALFNVAAGTMVGVETLDDGSDEHGLLYGLESTASVSVDLTGQPVSPPVYNVYIRFVHNPGVAGTRIFWDDDASQEASSSINTREVAGWSATAATASPGSDWIKIGEIDWDGAAVQAGDITHLRDMFFEGDEDGAFADAWGDGVNERNSDRGQYGIGDLYTWVQAVRRQIKDIIGSGAWVDGPATDLVAVGAHVADTSDPHGATLTQTNLDVLTTLDVSGGTTVVDTNGVTVSGVGSVTITPSLEANAVSPDPIASLAEASSHWQNTTVGMCVRFVPGVAPVIRAGHHNVVSVVQNAVGDYTINYDQALEQYPIVSVAAESIGGAVVFLTQVVSTTTVSVRVRIYLWAAGGPSFTLDDTAQEIHVMALIGDS